MNDVPVMSINGRKIGAQHPPYVIAELSANHNGDLNKALELIDVAKKSGASAIKIQTYRPDTITINCNKEDFQIKDGLWQGRSLYDLYDWAHTPWEWHPSLFNKARDVGLTLFSSPFDTTAVDLLEDLNTPAYKIASFEVIDLPLVEYVASTGKPLILSTGMASLEEISEAVEVVKSQDVKEFCLLLCVSGYPAPPEDYNLNTMVDMAKRFKCVVGLSDHTINNVNAIASVALGASVIEKHFTLDRQGGGPDDSFSLEPDDLRDLCQSTKQTWEALGKVDYSRKSSETGNVKFRRSLYFVKDIKAGEEVTSDVVKSIRPGYGLPPKHLGEVIGKVAKDNIFAGTRCSLDLIE